MTHRQILKCILASVIFEKIKPYLEGLLNELWSPVLVVMAKMLHIIIETLLVTFSLLIGAREKFRPTPP